MVPAVALVPPELEAPPLLDAPPLLRAPPVPVEPPRGLLEAVVPPDDVELALVLPPDLDVPPLALAPPEDPVDPPERVPPPELDERPPLEASPELEAPSELDPPPELFPPEDVTLLLLDEPSEADELADDDWLDPPWPPLALPLLEPPLLLELACEDPAVSSAPHPARTEERSRVEPNRIDQEYVRGALFDCINIILMTRSRNDACFVWTVCADPSLRIFKEFSVP